MQNYPACKKYKDNENVIIMDKRTIRGLFELVHKNQHNELYTKGRLRPTPGISCQLGQLLLEAYIAKNMDRLRIHSVYFHDQSSSKCI